MWHFLNPYSKGLNEDHGEIKPVESGGSSRVPASLWVAPVLSATLLGWDPVPRITLFDQIKLICRGCYSFKVLMFQLHWQSEVIATSAEQKKQRQRFFVCGGCVLTTTMIIVSFWQSLKSSEVQCYTKSSKILLQRMSLWEILLEHRWWRYNGATTMIIIIIWK